LFTVVNLARKQGIDAEMALRTTCSKFRQRFELMETAAEGQGRTIDELSIDEMEGLWQQAKAQENRG
jgi:tetrapyrrole methylase family protein/MazG family protein